MHRVSQSEQLGETAGQGDQPDDSQHRVPSRTLKGFGRRIPLSLITLSALFGGPANTTYGENTGVLVLSRVYDPRVIRLAAVYAIVSVPCVTIIPS